MHLYNSPATDLCGHIAVPETTVFDITKTTCTGCREKWFGDKWPAMVEREARQRAYDIACGRRTA